MARIAGPYIGVTGFPNREVVDLALAALPPLNRWRTMFGVLVTWESLRGIPLSPRRQLKHPRPADIQHIFPSDERALNLLHYGSHSSGASCDLLKDLYHARRLGGQYCHGFQLNLLWPNPADIAAYVETHPDDSIVLQLSPVALEQAGDDAGLLARLADYDGLVDRLLLDGSCGLGKPLAPIATVEQISLIVEHDWQTGFEIGVGGGLGPFTLHLIDLVRKAHPDTSWDAEGRLHNEEHRLVPEWVVDYLKKGHARVS